MNALALIAPVVAGTIALASGGAVVAALAASAAAPDSVIDKGTYRVYQRERALGTETFSFEASGDTLVVLSHVVQVLPGPDGDTLGINKRAALLVGRLDYDLKFYQSTVTARGRDLTRGLVMSDTAFTAYRETGAGPGEGDRFARPPGRFYVLDSQVFVLFDVMVRDLGSRPFTRRPVSVVLLRDEQDHVTQITATDLGVDTIRWAARPVVARKLRFADSYSTFHAWLGPQGYMLRLEQEGSGLRVERDPSPPLRRRDSASPR